MMHQGSEYHIFKQNSVKNHKVHDYKVLFRDIYICSIFDYCVVLIFF